MPADSEAIYLNRLPWIHKMQNQRISLKHRQKPIIPRSTVVGFRVSHDQLEKLKATQRTLKMLGVSGTTSDSLRIMLENFDLNSWRTKVQQSLTNKCLWIFEMFLDLKIIQDQETALAIFINCHSHPSLQLREMSLRSKRYLMFHLGLTWKKGSIPKEKPFFPI